MRLVFFGTPAFAVPTLARLLESHHQVVAVVTQPDRPRGRGQRVSFAPVKELAIARGLAIVQPERLARGPVEDDPVHQLEADLGVVAAYGKIIPEWLLQRPRHGMLNVHASLLPKYRGAAPVHRAILAGETETGITIMRVVKALDAGPMLARASRPIGPDESSDVVERDLAQLGADLLVRTLDACEAGAVTEVPQDDAQATYAPRLTKEEGLIDWRRSARDLHNHVRGLRPWPTAYTELRGQRVVIHEARLSTIPSGGAEAGACIAAGPAGITVACGDGECLDLRRLQLEGRRVVAARDFAAGHGWLSGQRFG